MLPWSTHSQDFPKIPRLIIALALLMGISATSHGQSMDKETLSRVKDSTVYIKNKIGEGGGTGSGFVIKVTGDKVLIMTNRHVVVFDEDEMPQGAKPVLTVVFRSGTPQEQELPAKILAYDHREIRDLAVLEVTGVKAPPEAFVADQSSIESELFETKQAYSLGFPLGARFQQMMNNKSENPTITVAPNNISKLSRDDLGQLSFIQFSRGVHRGQQRGAGR